MPLEGRSLYPRLGIRSSGLHQIWRAHNAHVSTADPAARSAAGAVAYQTNHAGGRVMACRIGMATDVAARVRDLKRDGMVPSHATYRTLETGLTYQEANDREVARRAACGSHCEGNPGGGFVAGRVWSVYRIDW